MFLWSDNNIQMDIKSISDILETHELTVQPDLLVIPKEIALNTLLN